MNPKRPPGIDATTGRGFHPAPFRNVSTKIFLRRSLYFTSISAARMDLSDLGSKTTFAFLP